MGIHGSFKGPFKGSRVLVGVYYRNLIEKLFITVVYMSPNITGL